MDLSCIISSGDLELYVLGMLSSEDASKIEQLAKLFPEIKAELDEIEEALLHTANEAEVAPAAAVKGSLFAKLQQLQSENGADTQAGTTIRNDEEHTAKVIPMPRRRSNAALLAASVIGLLAAIGFVAYLLTSASQNKAQMAALKTQLDSLNKHTTAQREELSSYAQSFKLYQDKDYQKINLNSVPGKPDALVQIFWNKQTSTVYAANVSLPAAPSGKQYQLWAIVNGKPVSAGLLSNAKQLTERMNTFSKADAFAVTLEKEGGSTTPTLTQMYVLGKTS